MHYHYDGTGLGGSILPLQKPTNSLVSCQVDIRWRLESEDESHVRIGKEAKDGHREAAAQSVLLAIDNLAAIATANGFAKQAKQRFESAIKRASPDLGAPVARGDASMLSDLVSRLLGSGQSGLGLRDIKAGTRPGERSRATFDWILKPLDQPADEQCAHLAMRVFIAFEDGRPWWSYHLGFAGAGLRYRDPAGCCQLDGSHLEIAEEKVRDLYRLLGDLYGRHVPLNKAACSHAIPEGLLQTMHRRSDA